MAQLDDKNSLDEHDIRLLRVLRENARLPLNQLASTIGLAASSVHARLTRLRTRGVIRRFTVEIDPVAFGYETEALVSVRIRPGARSQLTQFADQLRAHPQVAQFFYLAGAEDFVIHYRGRHRNDLRDFVTEHLSTQPIVAATNTSLIFEHELSAEGPLPPA